MTGPGSAGYRRRVAWTHVDPSGNYQFSAALRYAEEAEISLLRELGLLDRLCPHLPRTFVRAGFRAPAHFDEITVVIRVGRVGRSSVEFDFELRRGATLSATGTLGSANGGADGRAVPLPDDVAAELARHAARDDIVPAAERRQVVHGTA